MIMQTTTEMNIWKLNVVKKIILLLFFLCFKNNFKYLDIYRSKVKCLTIKRKSFLCQKILCKRISGVNDKNNKIFFFKRFKN